MPSLSSIYAARTIYHGYKNAFIDLGHQFQTLTSDDDLKAVLENYRPDLFITASHPYYRKFLDYSLINSFRKEGMFVLAKVDFWRSPIAKWRINEAISMEADLQLRYLMDSDKLADAYFHVVEQGDARMEGFLSGVGKSWQTIPLAADKTILSARWEQKFTADVSYIGTYLADKAQFFNRNVFPLGEEYDLKIYGQDWSRSDRLLGWVQRFGQYFSIASLASIRKPRLDLKDEAAVYTSSLVSINVHESYQKQFGGDCNERTFKIPLCGGFQVVDDVSCISKYFKKGEEVIIGETEKDWLKKVRYYIANPSERLAIIDAGRERVLKDHTYHNRVQCMLNLAQRTVN
jgi:spore maturation protein CgeB